jgi:metal-sulfur cluster biosynthetic enzyme
MGRTTVSDDLEGRVLDRLATVIDPETGVDVVRMRLIEGLVVDERCNVRYTFRPSSHVCPLAVSLALSIRDAVASVEGVAGQEIEVAGYIRADELNAILREEASM